MRAGHRAFWECKKGICLTLVVNVQSNRLGNDISFSDAGGVEIEENWDRVKKITLDTEQAADASALAPLLSTLPLELRPEMEAFIQACYEVLGPLNLSLISSIPMLLLLLLQNSGVAGSISDAWDPGSHDLKNSSEADYIHYVSSWLFTSPLAVTLRDWTELI